MKGVTRGREDELAERRVKVAELMIKQWGNRAIARELGVSPSTVYQDVQKIRQEWAQRQDLSYEQHVQEELARLEEVERRLWTRLEQAEMLDDAALDRWLKIVQERIKILGLHAPKEHKIVTESAVDQEIKRLNDELSQMGVPAEELTASDDDGDA